jgi:hypothetical protein
MNQNNPCQDCHEPFCYYYREYPECLGSGIPIVSAINGIQAPNFYGLQKPCGLVCPTCKGKRKIIVDCCVFYDGDF